MKQLSQSPIRDLLDLLHEEWLPDEYKKTLQGLIIELVENMGKDQNSDGGRWDWQAINKGKYQR